MPISSIFSALLRVVAQPAAPAPAPLTEVRQRLEMTVQDCQGASAQRLTYKINSAETAIDLWLLRSDLYQCISQVHGQAEADRRINALLDIFSGWMPANQLSQIS